MVEIQNLLRRFGCQSFDSMMDFEKKELLVQFQYRNLFVSVKASIAGYAAMWLKENPHTNRHKLSKIDHERKAVEKASTAVYSILRDWIKGQVTAIECGIISFEGAFLGQILLPSGETMLHHVTKSKLLQIESKS